MQKPCIAKNCLPTVDVTWNEAQCPSEDDTRHCVDCHGFCPTDYMWFMRCGLCKNCWCYDSQSVFAFWTHCDHIVGQEINESMSEKEIQTKKALEKGICPPCFLKESTLHCHDQNCPLNYDNFYLDWVRFGLRPIELGLFTIQTTHQHHKRFEVSLRRVPQISNDILTWKVDNKLFHYKSESEIVTSTNIEEIIDLAKKDILKVVKLYGIQLNLAFATSQGYGVLNKHKLFPDGFRNRDASPERKPKT